MLRAAWAIRRAGELPSGGATYGLSGGPRCLAATLLLVLIGASWLAGAALSQATAVIDREYAIKAAFLYQFSNYIDWPESAFESGGQEFVIGLYQSNALEPTLKKIAATKKVGGRSIRLVVLNTPAEASKCHMLFVPQSVSSDQLTAIHQDGKDTVLMVGETDDFIAQGGHIQFFIENNKVRFAFHSKLANNSELKVSSKLLALAKIIDAPPRSDNASSQSEEKQ